MLEYRPQYGQVIFIIATSDLKAAFGSDYKDWDCKAKSIFGRIHNYLPPEIFFLPSHIIAEEHLNGSFKLIRER